MNTPLLPACPKCGATLPVDAPKGLCPRCLAAMNFATETVLTGTDALAAQPPLSPAELAPHFPQLEIIECLGRGGMGVVYKARQKSLNRVVALKLLAPERVSDAKFAQRFTHEAQALAALNHPSIVTIYDFGQAGGFYFLLMEFVDGVNLRQAMKAGRFSPEQALAVVPPVCEALQYAHEHGIVHRDIKPENLLMNKGGRVKIADFGIAKLLHADGSDVGLVESQPVGTPQYMAPEQKEHRRTDHRADIYSLGVVLYELLTGELPADKLQPPSRKVLIDVRLDEIVLRALETKPELRYQNAGEFRTQVETVVSTPATRLQEPAQTSSTSPRLLKTGSSTLATPKLLATLQGQFFACHTRGQLTLDDRQFTHSRDGSNTVIPLATIRDLSIGQYPRMVNPAGIDFLSVIYEEGGQRKQVLLSPMKGWFALPSIFNAHIAEWHAAIREAVVAATGHAPASSPVGKIGTPIQSFVPLLALAAWLVPVGAALMMFIRRHETAGGFPGAVGLFEVAVFVICFSSVLLLFWLFSVGIRSTTSHSQRKRFLGLGLALAGLTLLLGAPVLNEFVDDHGLTATARKHLENRRRLGQAMTVAKETTAIKAGELSVAEEKFRDATALDELKRLRQEVGQLREQLTERRIEVDKAESALNQAALTKQVDEQQRQAWIQLWAGIVLALGCVVFLLGINPAGRFRRARLALPLVPVLLLGFLFLKFLRQDGSAARPQLAGQGLAILSSVSGVEVDNDNAVFRQRRYDGEGMIIAFGTGTNRWTPGGLYLDAMFDITLGWPAFGHGANWTVKARHGIHVSYRLDGAPGPMLGKLVFHPGTPAPEADGSYVIGEFRPDKGEPLPISVKLEKTEPGNQEDEIIRLARERLEQTRQLYRAKHVSLSQVDEAEGELALAEARGDLVKRAEARLIMATKYLERIEDAHRSGHISDEEYNQAKQRKLEAELELQRVRTTAFPKTVKNSGAPNWVSVSGPGKPGASFLHGTRKSLELSWEVKASQPGIVQLIRDDDRSTTELQLDPKTKFYHATVRLELTVLDENRILHIRQIGGVTRREEMRGDYASVAEILRTATNALSTVRGASIVLCQIQGKPLTVEVKGAVPSTQTTRHIGLSFPAVAIGVGAVILLMAAGVVALLVLLVRKGRGGGKTVLLVVGLMLLLFGVSVFTLIGVRASRAREEATKVELTERALREASLATESVKGQFIGLEQLVDAGNATPEAAWESRYWARAQGDYDAVIAATDPEMVSAAKAWMGNKATFRARSQKEFDSFKGVQILARKNLTSDKVELKYQFAFGNRQETKIVEMVKIQGAWKSGQTRAYDASWDDGIHPGGGAGFGALVVPRDTAVLHEPGEVHRAVGVGWLSMLVLLGVVVLGGVGVAVLLVVILRKRGTGAGKVLAVLCGVALLLFLLIGTVFVWMKASRAEASRAVAVEDQKQKRQLAAEGWANQRPPPPQTAGPSAGVGVALSQQGGRFIIGSIIPNTPAARDVRLMAGHQVLAVEDEGRDAVPLDGMALSEVIKLLRGEPGSIVTLHVQPSYMVLVEPIRIRLVREQLALLEAATKGQLLTNAPTTRTPAP